MKRRPILGYAVVGESAYMLGKDGVLWIADEVTLFPTRRAAQQAVARSISYAKQKGYKWETWKMRVRRVKAAV